MQAGKECPHNLFMLADMHKSAHSQHALQIPPYVATQEAHLPELLVLYSRREYG